MNETSESPYPEKFVIETVIDKLFVVLMPFDYPCGPGYDELGISNRVSE